MPKTATTMHSLSKKTAVSNSPADESCLSDKSVLTSTRKQVDAAYRRIVGSTGGWRRSKHNFLFGKKSQDT